MTRRGTLAYYLAAWVVGGFNVAFLFLLSSRSITPSVLLMTYFITLIAGAFGLLLFAFLLRLSMGLLKTYNLWIWMLVGALLSTAMIFLAAWISEKQMAVWQAPLNIATAMIFKGADEVLKSGPLQAPLDGAATAAVLCLVDRAFAKIHETPEATPKTKQSPA